jgi:hypothetical protein
MLPFFNHGFDSLRFKDSDRFGGLGRFDAFDRHRHNHDHDLTPAKNFVNSRLLNKLVRELEIPENAAVKALYYSGNNNIDKAIDWVERNQDTSEFDRALKVTRPEHLAESNGRFNYTGKRMITKDLKTFKDEFPRMIEAWKNKLFSEGEIHQINKLTDYVEDEEFLEDLLKKKETGE